MHFVIEQWKYKNTWLTLTKAQREAFIAAVGGAVEQLAKQGITTLGFGQNQSDADQRSNCDFWAVWQCPDDKGARMFQDAVNASGWYGYFEHTNIVGEVQSPPDILGLHISA